MQYRYDVNGLRLAVDAEAPDLIAPIEQYLAPFATEAFGRADYSITLGRGPVVEPPDGAAIVLEGTVFPSALSRLASEQDWLIAAGQFSVMTDRAMRVTNVRINGGCDRSSEGLAAIHAIDAALAASGQYLVHGAALTLPAEPPRALLIFAPSGSGKTTTALALALGGFGLMADDAVVLQPRDSGHCKPARAWGLPRPLKVHRRTAELLPAIAPLLNANWDSAEEQPLQMAAVDGLAHTVPPRPIPVVAIAVLEARSAGGHCIVSLDKAQALSNIAQDNIRRSKRGVSSDHVKRFEALSALLATTPVLGVRVGKPIELLADQLENALSAQAT